MLFFRRKRVWTGMSVLGVLAVAFLAGQATAAEDRGEAKLELEGKNIVIDYGRPSTEGKGYKSMQEGVPEGFLWRMGLNDATKIETEADLKFGEVVVKAGKYSLAAKKTKEGWDLLVHPKADRWGSPVPKDGYIATIPLKTVKPEEESKLLTIHLEEKEGKGHFKLCWGNQELSTAFEVAK